jgi:hypothetical protein
MMAICLRTTLRMTWVDLTRSVKIAAVPALPAGRERAKASSSSLTRTTKSAVGATAAPEIRTCSVARACRMLSTLPVCTVPGVILKVSSTAYPRHEIARAELIDLDADDRVGGVDEGHHRGE